MRRETAAAKYSNNMLRRKANPAGERSLDEQINELRKLLNAKRALYQSRDRSVEYQLESTLLDLILRHPYKGAPTITSLNTSNATISAVDNRKALIGLDPELLEFEQEKIIEDAARFFEKRPYAVGVTGVGANGDPALVVIEYFDKEAQARNMVAELKDRSRLNKFDIYSDKFRADFKNLADKVRRGSPVDIALARIGESAPDVATRSPAISIRKPKAVDRALAAARETVAAVDTAALSPHIGAHARRVKGRDYVFDLRYIPGDAAQVEDKCFMEITRDGVVVRSFWFKVNRAEAAKDLSRAMYALDLAISSSTEPPEKNAFLHALNRCMQRAVLGFGAL